MASFFTHIVITAKDSASAVFRALNGHAARYQKGLYLASTQTRQLTENSRNLRVSLSNLMAVYAALSGGQYIMKTAIDFDSYERSIFAAVGTQDKAADSIKFLEGVSDHLGLRLKGLMQNYKDLAGSTRGSNLEGKETQKIMLAVGTASSSMGLSMDATKLMIKAFRDMVSKGKISSEELTQQLGDHLPGALKLAADSMDMTKRELLDMMRSGELMAEDLIPRLTHAIYTFYSKSSSQSLNSARANINRLQNSFDNLIRTFSRSDLMNSFIDAVKEINVQIEFWMFNNAEFIKQDLPGHIENIFFSVKSFLSFIGRNPEYFEYGLVGYLVGGKKGLLIGSFLANILPPDLKETLTSWAKYGMQKTQDARNWAWDKRLGTLKDDLADKQKRLEQVKQTLNNPIDSYYNVSEDTISQFRATIKAELAEAQKNLDELEQMCKRYGFAIEENHKHKKILDNIKFYKDVLTYEDDDLLPYLSGKGDSSFFDNFFESSERNKFYNSIHKSQEAQKSFIQKKIFEQQELVDEIRAIQDKIELFTGKETYTDNNIDVNVNEAWESFLREKKARDRERRSLIDSLFDKKPPKFIPSVKPSKDIPPVKQTKSEEKKEDVTFQKNLVDIEAQFRTHSLRMENIAYQSYGSIANSFSDTVHSTIIGDLKSIEDLGRSVADSLAQSFSNIIGNMFTQSLYSSLGLPFPNSFGSGPGPQMPSHTPVLPPGHPNYIPSIGPVALSPSNHNISFNIVDRVGVSITKASQPTQTGDGFQLDLVVDAIENSIVDRAARGKSALANYMNKRY